MSRTVLLPSLIPSLIFCSQALSSPLVNLTVHQSLVSLLVNIPVVETRPVNQTTADGVCVEGDATVRGLVTGALNAEDGGAGLLLKMETQTLTSSRQSTWPRRNIFISFDWDITTQTKAYKRLALRTDGVASGDAMAYSESSIAYGPINAQANGLFPRFTAAMALRAAQREIYGRHDQSVVDANQSVGSQLAASLDQQVEAMLAPIKESFARFVEGPFVKRKLLGGAVGFGGDEIVAQIRVEEIEPQQGSVVSPLVVTELEPVAAEIHPKALENFIAKTLGGAVFSDMELIEMMFDQALPIDSVDDIHQKAEELLVHFDETKPIALTFNADEIVVVARGSRVETLGRSWTNIDIKRVFKIKKDNGKILLSFMEPWSIAGRDGSAIDPVYSKHMIARLDEILPQGEIDISGVEIGRGLPVKLKLASIRATDQSLLTTLSASVK